MKGSFGKRGMQGDGEVMRAGGKDFAKADVASALAQHVVAYVAEQAKKPLAANLRQPWRHA